MEKTVRKFLDTILDTITPPIATLSKGADDTQVAEFERGTEVTLLPNVHRLYQTFNGQKKGNNDVLFIDELCFLPLSEIKEAQQQRLQHLEKVLNWQDLKFDEEEAIDMYWDGVVKNQFYNPKQLLFLTDGVRYIFIDLDPDKKGIIGQIGELELSVDFIEDSFMDIFNESISEWFESINDDLEKNLICYDPDLHSLADSFVFDEENVMSNILASTPDYVSEGGSNVYDYSKKDQGDFVILDRSCVYMDGICKHFEKYIGIVDGVFHEIVSEYMHIDMHWIKPTAEHPYHVLFTTGTSDYPMCLPEGLDDPDSYSHVELMVYLPAGWQISDEAFKDNNNYWPVYFLEMIARFPHQYKTRMTEGHITPNGEYAEPIANTEFGCILLMPPYLSAPEEFLRLETKDGTLISFYALVPIYPEGMELKLEEGVNTLLELLDDNNITEVIDIHRKNVALE